jgi:hypothetical protein
MCYSLELTFPNWFLSPGEYPDQIIGYTIGESSPMVDAVIMLCFYKEVIIEGSYYRYNDHDGRISDYYWNYQPECVEEFSDSLYLLSSFVSNILTDSHIGIFALSEFDIKDDRLFINIEEIDRPEWIEEDFWIEDGYYYSVGMYTSRGEKNDAWKTAEERAFFNLVTSASVHVGAVSINTIMEDFEGHIYEDYEKVIGYKLHTKLSNSQVLERWPDMKKNLYYVLVRVHEDDIKIKK